MLNIFVIFTYKCKIIWENNLTNVIILSDMQLFTRRMLYINIVRYYWQKLCEYVQFILFVTFITLNYITD